MSKARVKAAAAGAGGNTAAREVSLQGWDTANVVTHDVLNAAIVAQKTTPKPFQASSKFSGTVQGVWGDWQMVSDPAISGGKIKMMCPILSGTGIDVTQAKNDLAGAVVYVTVTLAAVNDPKVVVKDKTAAPPPNPPPPPNPKADPQTQALKPLAQGTPATPPVDVLAITDPPNMPGGPGALEQRFLFLFKDWFNANIGLFDQVFHAAVINEKADKDDFQWLKPTHLSYASVTNLGGDGFFSALCQTDADDWTSNAQQIDVGIGENLPAGANSVFAISGEKFAEYFLRRGAAAVMQGSDPDKDFDIVGDELIVTNNKALLWQNMQLDDQKTMISPTVPKGGFTCRVVEDQIELSFTGMTYSCPLFVGSDVYHINFKQRVHIELGKNSAGKFVLITTNRNPDDASPKEAPDIREAQITVMPDYTATTFEKVMDIVSIAASVLSLGAFAYGKWAVSGAKAAATAASVRAAVAASDAIINVTLDGGEVASMASSATVAEGNLAAAAAFTAGGPPLAANYATFLSRFAMLTGFVAALSTLASVSMKLATQQDGNIDQDKIPSLDDFLDNALGASQWPTVKDWALQDVRLAQSLLMYGKLST